MRVFYLIWGCFELTLVDFIVSGVVPKEPVVAKTSGLVFEKALVEKVLRVEEKCPVTGAPLRLDDLITIQANKITPPVSSATVGVPGILQALQNQWDEAMLESFKLRQQLDLTRKELATALYQHDAACRVIARLVRERDEAFQMLNAYKAGDGSSVDHGTSTNSNVVASAPTANAASNMDVDEGDNGERGVSAEVVAQLNTVCKSLSAGRKQRKASDQLQSKDDMMVLEEAHSYSPHKNASIRSVLVREGCVITGGDDRAIVVTDLASGRSKCKISGHTGAVSALAAAAGSSGLIFSGSDDKSVRFWGSNSSGGYTERFKYNRHSDVVTGLTLHPSGDYLVSTSANGEWHFLDVQQAACLVSVPTTDSSVRYNAVSFHPDGLLLGTACSNGQLKIWDAREQKNVVTMAVENASVECLSFSENGYYTAAGYSNGVVNVWDLRKQTSAKTFELGQSAVKSVAIDYSGTFLGIGGGGDHSNVVHVKVIKDWSSSVVSCIYNCSGVYRTDFFFQIVLFLDDIQ
jgi:pre-mRNA-processing factor 19